MDATLSVLAAILAVGFYILGMAAARQLVSENKVLRKFGFAAFLVLAAIPAIPISVWAISRLARKSGHDP